jgi:hypothetical protein
VSINTRVRATSEPFMVDVKVHHQRHRTHHICEVTLVTSQLDVPTSLTSDPSHLFRFHFVYCAKDVSELINHPFMIPPGTRVGGTSDRWSGGMGEGNFREVCLFATGLGKCECRGMSHKRVKV